MKHSLSRLQDAFDTEAASDKVRRLRLPVRPEGEPSLIAGISATAIALVGLVGFICGLTWGLLS